MEGQKAEAARRAAEAAVLSKLDRIRVDQTQRARTLEEEAHDAELKVGAVLLFGLLNTPPHVESMVSL